MKKVCKYHKKNGQEFHVSEIVPRGMCFEAFSIAYPSALALLYNADTKTAGCTLWKPPETQQKSQSDSVTFQCPSAQNKVVFEMARRERLPWLIKNIKHAAEMAFGYFFFPIDWVHKEHDVVMKVTKVTGNCPHGHKVGDKYLLNTQDTDVLCPASFNSLYSFIRLLYQGVKVPWAQEKNNAFIHCPDHEGIIYKIQNHTTRSERR